MQINLSKIGKKEIADCCEGERLTSIPFIHLLVTIESSPQTIIWNSRCKQKDEWIQIKSPVMSTLVNFRSGLLVCVFWPQVVCIWRKVSREFNRIIILHLYTLCNQTLWNLWMKNGNDTYVCRMFHQSLEFFYNVCTKHWGEVLLWTECDFLTCMYCTSSFLYCGFWRDD